MPRLATRELNTMAGRKQSSANAPKDNTASLKPLKLKNCENGTGSATGVDEAAAAARNLAGKRSALGEITNEKLTLKGQVKRGLSVMVNRKSSASLAEPNNHHPTKVQQQQKLVTAKKSKPGEDAFARGNLPDLSAVPPAKPTRKHRPGQPATGSTSLEISGRSDSNTSELFASSSCSSFNSSSQRSLQSSRDLLGFSRSRSGGLDAIIADSDDDDDDNYVSAEECVSSESKLRYRPPQRALPPSGVQDFDLQNWDDPGQCSEYVQDIFEYYKSREAQFRCPDYMKTQADITETMRAVLVDWLVEVQESFELNHETLYSAVKLVDLYLSKVSVPKEDLQLVGAVACLISCKLDERIPPSLDDFVYVCDDAYTRHDIVEREICMISAVDFDLGFPLSYRFLRRYGRVCQVSMSVLTLARYVLETSLMEYKFNVELSESLLAAACLVLAMKVMGVEGWVETLKFYSNYSPSDVYPLVRALLRMMRREPRECIKTIRQKYSHKVFHEVALCKFPSTIELSDRG